MVVVVFSVLDVNAYVVGGGGVVVVAVVVVVGGDGGGGDGGGVSDNLYCTSAERVLNSFSQFACMFFLCVCSCVVAGIIRRT